VGRRRGRRRTGRRGRERGREERKRVEGRRKVNVEKSREEEDGMGGEASLSWNPALRSQTETTAPALYSVCGWVSAAALQLLIVIYSCVCV